MKVPDIDFYERRPTTSNVVITIRGIGEMEADNPAIRHNGESRYRQSCVRVHALMS